MILRLNKTPFLASGRWNRLRSKRNLSISITSKQTESNEKQVNAGVRLNQVNVQMISEKMRSYLFDQKNAEDVELIRKAQENLKKFSLGSGDIQAMKEPGDQLELPKLKGKNLSEHFYNIGREQTEVYLKLLSKFGNNNLNDQLKMPKEFVFKPGWTRYDHETGEISQVAYPPDHVLVFDVETLVLNQNCPVIAVALSDKALYSWCSERLVNNDFMYLKSLELTDLIPFESSDLTERKSKKRLVIGHNVGFDRSFIREQYYLEKSGLRFLDTMSLHIACFGYTSEQRAKILNNDDDDLKAMKNRGKHGFMRTAVPNFKWRHLGSLNNLKDVHSLHCPGSVPIQKDDRQIFIKGTPEQVIANFNSLMEYCAKDVFATYEVYKQLFPTFLERFPHPITLGGMLEMSTMYLPTNQNWLKFIENCQNAYDDAHYILKKMLEKSANEACKLKDVKDKDPWLFDLDWSTKNFKLLKASEKNDATCLKKIESALSIVNDNLSQKELEQNPFYKIIGKKYKNQIENWEENMNISKLTDMVLSTCKWLPRKNQYLINDLIKPSWYRELCEKYENNENWQPGPSLLTTKTRVTPNLLRLTWNGFPLHYHSQLGWGFLLTDLEYKEMKEKETKLKEEQVKEKKTPKKKSKKKETKEEKREEEFVRVNDKIFQKIPHKDGDEFNVGNPLAKSFINKINEGVMGSMPEKLAKLALKFYTNISYWENNEKRIRSQKAVWLSEDERFKSGAILPTTVVAGTITRRAVEPTWLTASNYMKDRIGGELKAMIQSPSGYNFVGADVDSQELWIASTIGDSHFARIHGSTALGWMNLQGKKADGTDMHSKTASMIGISRDQAKIFNYGRIYGAGKAFAVKLLMQFDPTLDEEEAKQKANKMYAQTKGKKVKVKAANTNQETEANEFDANSVWKDGTESEMFNKLEEIARSRLPKTPVLGATITKTLEPVNVADEVSRFLYLARILFKLFDQSSLINKFMTSRINWVVQSSAVDYLHIMLVCMNWLIKEYDINARFSISIHDEVRYIVKEEDKYRAALALQITNLLTRALFSYKLGFDDLPMSVAFFSAVDIDKCLRKEPDLDFVSPSNPNGLSKGYGVPKGVCMDIYDIISKTNGRLSKNSE